MEVKVSLYILIASSSCMFLTDISACYYTKLNSLFTSPDSSWVRDSRGPQQSLFFKYFRSAGVAFMVFQLAD